MNDLLQFLTLQDANVRFVVLGVMLLSSTSSIIGCFALLRKRSLVGDAVAHAVLPGICLSFIVTDSKDPWILLLGAFVTGWLSIYAIDFISNKSKLKPDTAVALVLSVFFGAGVMLLSHIQHQGSASQSGLDKFLFGKAASLVGNDLITFASVAMVLLVVVALFYKEFKLISFDIKYAKTIGYPVKFIELLLSSLTVLAVIIGIQAVGVVLMAAILITPAAAARTWTDKLQVMIFVACIIASLSSLLGTYASYIAPSMPTGPWIVLFMSGLAFVSFLIAPQKGILSKYFKQVRNRKKIQEENVLKLLFRLGEQENDYYKSRMLNEMKEVRDVPANLSTVLRGLIRHGFVERHGNAFSLTKAGKTKGQRMVRIHRLWEAYLSEHLQLPADHVHFNAEAVEHVITHEIEADLVKSLSNPNFDPHQSEIPKG
jgi:manganese/zinc/iron transport system permease protein